MAKKGPDPFDEVERTYTTLRHNFSDIMSKCRTDEQKDAARDTYSGARDAYFEAVKRDLRDNNDLVKSLTKELADANGQMERDLKALQDIAAFLRLVTEAVKLAASIVVLAAA